MHREDQLGLHGVRDEADAERFVAFNAAINGESEGATCDALLHYFPAAVWDDFVLVEDEESGEVVSTTCALPWRLDLDGVALDTIMLEMVVTHPNYRHRGLVRRQIDRFHQRAAEKAADLCIIEGIPYFYRQFGYAYALDHWAADALPAALVPDFPTAHNARLRRAVVADIATLASFHEREMGALPLHATRSADEWTYLLQVTHYPVYMVEASEDATPVGYVCGWRSAAGDSVYLVESSSVDGSAALAVLQICKPLAPVLRLGWPQQGTLVQVGRNLGSHPHFGDQWLIRIPDLPRLLARLAPVWAARLDAGGYGRLNAELTINLYRTAYRMRFVNGTLVGVDPLGFVDASMGADGGDLCIPPDAFTRLLLGYRTLDELRDAWPDIVICSARRHLLETLFPKRASYVWLPYLSCGHFEPLA